MGGRDKAALDLDGRRLLDHAIALLRPQVARIAVSIATDGTDPDVALPVLRDGHAGQGPLAGLSAGLLWTASVGGAGLLTIPVDAPFLPGDLARRLCLDPGHAALAEAAGQVHATVAYWPAGCGPALAAYLDTGGSRAIRAFADHVGARLVPFPDARAFANLNTPDDLADARRRLQGGKPQ
jgi:molybdenum cofactor guanylyltransferase